MCKLGLDETPGITPEALRELFSSVAAAHASQPWALLRVSQLVGVEVDPARLGFEPKLYGYLQIQAQGQGFFLYPSLDAFHAVAARRDSVFGKQGGSGLGGIPGVLQVLCSLGDMCFV